MTLYISLRTVKLHIRTYSGDPFFQHLCRKKGAVPFLSGFVVSPLALWYSLSDMKRIFVLCLVLLLAGCNFIKSNDQSKSPVVARFDGVKVTEEDLFKKIRTLPRALQSTAMQRKKDLIEDMAAEHFLMKEAERQGLNKDPEVEDLIRAAQKKIVVAKLIDKEIDKKITIKPEDVSQYYQFHQQEFMTPLLMKASHILVKTESEAKAILASLNQGASFEDLARQKSIDGSAVRGGDLGVFQKGQFVPEFEEQVVEMKKGEIRGPVKTQFGYHIIRLNDRIEPRLRDFQTVKNVAEERLVHERRAKAFKSYVEKLKGNIKIDIDEKTLNRLREPSQ